MTSMNKTDNADQSETVYQSALPIIGSSNLNKVQSRIDEP